MSAPVLVVEHEAGCPPDRLTPWLVEAGCVVDLRRPYAGDELPTGPALADRVAGVVVLGGQMGAYDDAVAPWLPQVRQLLADAVRSGVPVLGICLGAQLLAVAGGGRVERGATGVEAGVVEVHWRPAASAVPLVGGLADPFPGPSMHNDAVVDLPAGAVWLGSTPRYPYQVFRVGERAWGVQFHPEVGPGTFRTWAAHHPDVDEAAMVRDFAARDQDLVAAGRELAHRFAALTARSASPASPASPTPAAVGPPGSRP